MARYFNIYKSGRSKNKKINSSCNTHPINLRFCGSLCIMLRYHHVKFQRLASFGWRDILIYCSNTPKYLCKSGQSKNKKINSSWNLRIMISYLCVKFQSLTSLHRRDILVTDKRTNGQTDKRTDECEFIGHRFVKPVTNKSITMQTGCQGRRQ